MMQQICKEESATFFSPKMVALYISSVQFGFFFLWFFFSFSKLLRAQKIHKALVSDLDSMHCYFIVPNAALVTISSKISEFNLILGSTISFTETTLIHWFYGSNYMLAVLFLYWEMPVQAALLSALLTLQNLAGKSSQNQPANAELPTLMIKQSGDCFICTIKIVTSSLPKHLVLYYVHTRKMMNRNRTRSLPHCRLVGFSTSLLLHGLLLLGCSTIWFWKGKMKISTFSHCVMFSLIVIDYYFSLLVPRVEFLTTFSSSGKFFSQTSPEWTIVHMLVSGDTW